MLGLMLAGQPMALGAAEATDGLPAEELGAHEDLAAESSHLKGLPPERQRTVLRAIEGARSNIWWNKPRIVESLALQETQRQVMDRHLEVFLLETLTFKDQPLPPNHFRLGLLDGDFAAARVGLAEQGERAKQRSMREGEMMLRVLEGLSEEQWKLFRTRHRRLLNRSWVLLISGQGRAGKGVPRRRPVDGTAAPRGPGG